MNTDMKMQTIASVTEQSGHALMGEKHQTGFWCHMFGLASQNPTLIRCWGAVYVTLTLTLSQNPTLLGGSNSATELVFPQKLIEV